ncbi:FtsX-like permease family protein [Isoptericola variabilis]|uniref:ABC3 transporter permease C-terminal domain-containing protein n=1 Tax=Isoptericola variabilis (strain 225) TaxID=743718 RepID=F6FPJ4_ISOV2|nr:FtsX-like permease family protein [Isoptericola variabilis]AEG43707.1 protein of unknown function DUF214 [Isoptericola variabilis 225]TWH27387.1 putative ABC-type transport system involved in lysophospholipase L1 biosynthesis, permease component [Isoptericola variabilis J7]
MNRARLLARRAGAHRGLLSLVAVLVAAVAATVGVTLGSVQSATVDGARQALAQVPEPARSLVVTTRLASDGAGAEAQDARVREVVDRLFGGVPVDVERAEVPDDASGTPFVTWTLAPRAAETAPADLGVLADGAERLRPVLRDDDAVAIRGLTVEGALGETARSAHEALRAAQAVAAVPVTLLGLVALVALVQVARLLAATRDAEVGLAVSRGAAPRQVAAAATTEAVVLSAVAAAAGSVAAAAVLAARGEVGTAGTAGTAGTVALAGAATALAAAAVLGIVAGLQVRAVARRRVTDRSGRARQAAALGTVVLTMVLAAVCLAQLRRYGSPLVTTPEGVRTDPLATAAPALVLAALAVVVLAVLGPAARAWAAGAARGTGATGVLAARHVSRGLVVMVVPVVLLVLASGAGVLAATYAGTSEALRADAALLRNGTDVRVVLPSSGPVDVGRGAPDVAAYAALDGASAAAPVLALDATVDSDPVALLGVPAAALPDVVRAPAGTTDPGRIAAAVATEGATAPAVAPDATHLDLTVTGTAAIDEAAWGPNGFPGPDAELRSFVTTAEDGRAAGVRVWLAGGDGTLALVDAGELGYDLDGDGDARAPIGPAPAMHRLSAEVPPAPAGGWAVAGVDLQLAGTPLPLVVAVRVDEAVARTPDGEVPVDLTAVPWASAAGATTRSVEVEVAEAGPGAVVRPGEAGSTRVRLVPGRGTADAVPVAMSAPLAGALGLAAGDGVELTVAGSRLAVTVADVVDVVPGELRPAAALADLGALGRALLRSGVQVQPARELWVAAEAPAALPLVRAAAAELAGEGARVLTPEPGAGDVDAAAPVRATFALAAGGAGVLALVGVATVAVAVLRGRRHEVVVLRAVGVGPREQAAGRALELLVVGLAAIAAGLAAGVLVARLTVPGLAHATLTGVAATPDAVLRVEPWLVAGTAAGLVAGLAVVAAGAGARVAAQARDTEYREEVR